jgi:hypothetical protein
MDECGRVSILRVEKHEKKDHVNISYFSEINELAYPYELSELLRIKGGTPIKIKSHKFKFGLNFRFGIMRVTKDYVSSSYPKNTDLTKTHNLLYEFINNFDLFKANFSNEEKLIS